MRAFIVLVCIGLAVALIIVARKAWLKHVDKRQCDSVAKMREQDVFNLHPGTKGLITQNVNDPSMWQLPSGRIVYHRYWKRLEGVESAE